MFVFLGGNKSGWSFVGDHEKIQDKQEREERLGLCADWGVY